MNLKSVILMSAAVLLMSCGSKDQKLIENDIALAKVQLLSLAEYTASNGPEIKNPVCVGNDGNTKLAHYSDWRSGFFPGSLWYLYELTQDESILPLAKKHTLAIQDAQNLTSTHDLGFMVYCSFGNGLRLTKDKSYEQVIIQAANSLITRFHEGADIIQSWNARNGWLCPVIIDNMMNLELLFRATELTGDKKYHDIAVRHANKTMKEHFREDGSTYHVVDYDPQTGAIRGKYTSQGYQDSSTWSRGQTWAIYGFTTAYRFTKDDRYLAQAQKAFDLMWNHPGMPEDKIPYWDMDVPKDETTPRDASSACIMASALYELSTLVPEKSDFYKSCADGILRTLSSEEYLAKEKENHYFILMHSVSSLPGNSEIDVPLSYADYYFLEAIKRKLAIESGKSIY